jgi:hypothetical protein
VQAVKTGPSAIVKRVEPPRVLIQNKECRRSGARKSQ